MSNAKKTSIAVILVILVILLAVVLSNHFGNGCNKNNNDNKITSIIPETKSVTGVIDSLKKEIEIQQRIIDECGKKIIVNRDRVIHVPGPQTTIYAPAPYAPPPTQTLPTKITPPAETKIYVAPQGGLDQIFYESGSKIILFCIRLGGSQDRHVPHLAMLNGEKFGDSRTNNQSGFNWEIAPEELTDGFVGEYGLTKDGTFYVKRSLVDRYMVSSDNGLVEIKTTATGWNPTQMKISGGYYFYKK